MAVPRGEPALRSRDLCAPYRGTTQNGMVNVRSNTHGSRTRTATGRNGNIAQCAECNGHCATTLFMHCARAQHSRGETSHHLKRLKALALPFRRARWSPHGPLTTVPACLSCSLYIAVLGRKHSKAPGNAEHSSPGRRALVLERRHAG